MTQHSYPLSALLGDYFRAAAGVFPTIAIVVISPVGIVEATILGGFAALFGLFALRTALRHATCLETTEAGLRASGPRRVSISWSELDRMRLAYYSTRRDRREGWMQLDLRAGRSTLRVDSRMEGFAQLVKLSAEAAAIRRLSLDPATSGNLQALGVELRTAAASLPREAAQGFA